MNVYFPNLSLCSGVAVALRLMVNTVFLFPSFSAHGRTEFSSFGAMCAHVTNSGE